MSKPDLTLYIAGKVSKESHFGTHHWRDDFCAKLVELSGLTLDHLDPLEGQAGLTDPKEIFAKDCKLIAKADVLVVYLSDDISVGGSQEILIARYLQKPVIGLAPFGGKFNGVRKEMLGHVIEDYKDPFVFATCDRVCGNIEEVAEALCSVGSIHSSGMQLIDEAIAG
jgi:hypothetical protein